MCVQTTANFSRVPKKVTKRAGVEVYRAKTDMKAVLTPRSNGHGILSLIDNLCAPPAFQYLLNDSHSDV